MDFDDAKENIQPLAAGRNASILHASLHVESPQELQGQRHELEQIIHTYKGEDPLEAWYDYITWIEQSYPSGGKESGLEEVLTKCLTAFERDERYLQDRRLIRLYIKFIEMQKNQNATEFYQQLFNEGIGTMVADFYICWAYCYDLSGNYRKADEIFRRGIANRAEPLEELQEAHQHFGFTISQRMLYKDDENATESANRQLHERRLALSSLRSHRKKVGSVRTGAAVKSYVPGKLQTDTSATASRQGSNVRVQVFSDENQNPQTTSTAAAAAPELSSEESMQSKSVVRCIIDLARNQENKKEPGPWNKAHDKKKGKLFRPDAATTDLGFEILEDDSIVCPKKPKLAMITDNIVDIEPFKPFPNFRSKNRPLPEWSTPVTIENTTQPRAYPQYHKSKLYPRPNLEYQIEELCGYNWLTKRGIKNNFTRERDAVWKSHEIGPVRKYPNFATKSRAQKLDALDAYFEPEKKAELIVDMTQMYNTTEQLEMQLEEIIMQRWQAGQRKIRYDVNQTIIMATEMDETVCVPHDVDPANRRKSFFPTRKSMARRTSMMPKVTTPTLPMQAVGENEENEPKDVVEEKKVEVNVAEQILSQSFEKCTIKADSEQPTTSAAALAKAKTKAVEQENQEEEAAAASQPVAPIAHAIYQDSFEFKTPALPVATNVKSKLPFEIYEESIEERYQPPQNNENYEFFEADETCSTQAFNCFIKQQSVSTPNAPQKTVSRIFGTVLREKTELEAVTEPPLATPATPNNGATDVKVATNAMGALHFSPPCQKQLSTILETSEQGTNTKSTISSPECDALDAKSGVTAHTHLETLKEQTCETTSRDSILEPNTDAEPNNTVQQPTNAEAPTTAAATPAGARLHKGGGVNFSIFEDCTESAVALPKQVGNFSRLEEHEDTTPGYMIQSIKFQEDKTETVPKMLFSVKQDAKFPEEKTETFSKLLFAPAATAHCEEDKTENLVKIPFEPPSLDNTFNFFTQTPPKPTKSSVMSTTQERSMLSTTEFLGFNVDDIPSAPKPTTKYDDAPQLRDTLSFFDKINASNREKQAAANERVNLINEQQKASLPLLKNTSKNNLKDSFMPHFSLIEETQPQAQHKLEELHTKNSPHKFSLKIPQEFSFTKDSQPQHIRAGSSFKQNPASAHKPPTTTNKSLMRDSFQLPDYSMVMDSQPTQQPPKELSYIKDSQPQHSRAGASLKQNPASAHKPPTTTNKSLMRDSFQLPDYSMVMDSQPTQQPPKELSYIKDSQPQHSRAGASLKQNPASAHKPPTTTNKSLMRDSFQLPDYSMVMDSQPTQQPPKELSYIKDSQPQHSRAGASLKQNPASAHKPPTTTNKSLMRDSFQLPDYSMVMDSQPPKELSYIKDSQPQHSRAGASLKQNPTSVHKPPTTTNKSLMRDSFQLPDYSMVMESQPAHQQSGTRWQRTEPSHEHILTDSYMKDFSAIKEPTPQKAAPNISIVDKINSSNSTSFKASPEMSAQNSANLSCKKLAYTEPCSAKLQELSNPLPTTTTSAPNRKSIKPDDFFEFNAETAQFAPNLSIIRNSTLLPQEAKQRYTQFHEKSLHIKEELPIGSSYDDSFEMLKSPPDARKSVPAKTAKTAAAAPMPPTYVYVDDDVEPAAARVADIEENSIYFAQTPKTPKIERHIWNHSSEDELQTTPNFIHRTPDLNHTQQIIEHIHLEDNVNPFNAKLINAFLEQIDFTNFIEELSTCQLIGKVKQLHKDAIIAVNDVKFKVQKLIGEGAYGAVYCASQMKTGKKYALKQERPPNYWEYYICLEVHSRLAVDELLPAFMSVDYALIGNNAGILISPLSPYGSLITVCNKIKRVTTKNCDEYVVMHITCLLLEMMDHLHAIEIIHADIKADNFLLMDKLSYDRKQPSIQLIDFGVSIDMRLFKKNQTFSYTHKNESIKCVEMRENRRWTYQLDLFGLAGVIHVLLFGKYMDVERNMNGFWMHTTHVPRYLNKSLWETIFKSLLNIRDCSSMPNLQNLRVLIKEELAEKESYVLQKIFEFNRVLDC